MSNANSATKIHAGNMIVQGVLTSKNYYTEGGWVTYVPTVTGGALPTTTTVNNFKYILRGAELHIRASVSNTVTTGAASSAAYTFSLPSGCKLLTETTAMVCGAAFLQTVGSGKKYTGCAYIATTGSSPAFGLMLGNEVTAVGVWGNASPHATDTNLDFAGGLIWSADVTIQLDPTSTILTSQPK